MTRTLSCAPSWKLFSAPLKTLALMLYLIQPCHATGMQEVTAARDPLSSGDSRTTSVLTLNLPTTEARQAANRDGFGTKGQVPSAMLVKEAHPPGVNWNGVLVQSAFFLGIQQGWRLGFQDTTREALKGKFFDDWFESVKSTHGWGDGDDFITNYIGHPMAGGVVGNIFVQNDPGGRQTTFGRNPAYWTSRLKGMLYTGLYSAQFELGPLSEASVGNVGHMGNSQSGAVDLVITPLAGFGWQVGEDVLDKYLITKIETRTTNPYVLMFARSVLNPTRAFANVMRFRVPWHRETRPGIFGRGREYFDPQADKISTGSPSLRAK